MNPLLQALFALVIGGMALSYGLPLLLDAQMQPAQNDAGNQIAEMQAAGAGYIRGNSASLAASIPVGGNVAVTPQTLKTAGALPNSFNDSNVFGQQHILVIAQPSSGVLDGMVYTYGGDTIIDKTAIRVAEAGPPNSTVVLSTDTANFEGAAGGETEAVSIYQNATYPVTVGHIGAHILAASYSAEAPFLNRYNTGVQDDNTMHTAEYMNGNNLDMANSDSATTGGGNVNMAGGNVNSATQVTATQQVNTPMVADPTTPTYQITMAGTSNLNNMVATGNVTAASLYGTNVLHTSDARLKENIQPLTNCLDVMRQIGSYRYDWRETGRASMGVVAQQVQQIVPEAVMTRPDGYLGVDYNVIDAQAFCAVKELADRLDRVEQERNALAVLSGIDPAQLPGYGGQP